MSFQLHETMYGKTFFEYQLPQIIKAINRNAEALEQNNKLIEESKETQGPDVNFSEVLTAEPLLSDTLNLWTKDGLLSARVSRDPEYPGISICLNDEQIAVTEYESSKGIRTLTWNEIEEDYVHETVWAVNKIDSPITPLDKISTKQLVEELTKRTGVRLMDIEPYEKFKAESDSDYEKRFVDIGPAKLLIVID